MSAILSLLRYSLRQLLKSPGFTITAIVILGCSIGMSTAIFSLIDAVILKPLPFPNYERLVEVCEPHQNHPFSVFDYPDYVDTVTAQHTFDFLALKREITVDLRTEAEAQLLEADFVSPSLFRATGLPTILGRIFTEEEDTPNGPLVAVLSQRCWRSRFQSDPNILGKNLILSDLSFQVIGIVPSQLDDWGPPGVDVYLPIHTIVPFSSFGDPFALRNTHLFTCFGRLKPGVSVSEAEADLKRIHDNLLSQFPGVNIGYGLRVFPLLGFIVHGYSMTIWLLAAAVGVLLIVSCLNVANLLFARRKKSRDRHSDGFGSTSSEYPPAYSQARAMAGRGWSDVRYSGWTVARPLYRQLLVWGVCRRSNHVSIDCSRAWDRHATRLSVTGGEGDTDQPGERSK
jgi:hypothetical protein